MLLFEKRGPKSFADLRTIDNEVFDTY